MNIILKRPTLTEKILRYKKGIGLSIAAIATAATMSGLLPANKEELTMGVLQDGTMFVTKDKLSHDNSKTYKAYTFNKDGTVVNRHIESKHVTDSVELGSKYTTVYTIKDEKGANLRSTPEVAAENKLGAIPYQSLVLGNSKDDWTKVVYITADSVQTGFVSSQLLEKKEDLLKKDTVKDNVKTNEKHTEKDDKSSIRYVVENDQVLGIDVSGIHPKQLRKLLTGELEISNNVRTKRNGIIDISRYEHKKPNFVFIKLGASKIFSSQIEQGYDTDYQELASVCEELKVPYGFYYYSTCVDKTEAKKEFTWIKESMDKLGKRNYNLLPFAIDVEVALLKDIPTKGKKIDTSKDRQYKKDMKTVTSAKAELANLLDKTYGKSILYTSRNACDPDLSSRMLDIEQYQKELNTGNSHIWFVSPKPNALHEASLQKIEQHVHGEQIVLDANVDATKRNLIDINSFKADSFKSYIDGTYTKTGLQYAKTKDKSNKQYLASNDRSR